MKTILIIDDHDIVRFGLQMLIQASNLFEVVATESTLEQGLRSIDRFRPDLAVCDMSMQDSKGLDTVRAVIAAQGDRAVLIVSMHDEMIYAEQALAAGAKGYLMKENTQENILQAIQSILSGNTWVSPSVNSYLLNRLMKRNRNAASASATVRMAGLSQRELEVLEKIGKGKTTKQIAFELELSPRTVDIHRANLRSKLELKSSAEIMAFAMTRT
jgi:DNA-binding NarL/FixJ family response regulator